MDERMRLCLDEGTCKDCEAWGRTTDLGGEAGEGGRGQEDGGEGEAGILRHTLTPHLTSQLQSVSFKLFKQQCC